MGLGIPEAPKTWHVLEFKTHNSKSFAKLEKEGVQKSNPMHYAQMQVYMGCTLSLIHISSALEPLVFDATCRAHNVKSIEEVGGGYGKGYVESLRQWRDILSGLDALRAEKNMASILIGHVKVKRFDDPTGDSYDTYAWDINDKAASLIYRWADVILFANTKVQVRKEEVGFKKEKKRAIDTTGGRR